MKKAITKGLTEQYLRPQLNNNFNDLYLRSGNYIRNFLAKANAPAAVLKENTIRVVLCGDSISGSYALSSVWFFNRLQSLFPNATFEFKLVSLSGTGSDYMIASMCEIVNYNPDLVFCMEFENLAKQFEYYREMIRQIRLRTSSEIMLIPWSIYRADMQLLADKNLAGWKASESYKMRNAIALCASENKAAFVDWHRDVIPSLWTGEKAISYYYGDGETVHPQPTFYETCDKVIIDYLRENAVVENGELFVNSHLLNAASGSDLMQYHYLYHAKSLPDITDLILSGTWAIAAPNTDKTNSSLNSSEVGAYVISKFKGIGFKLAYYGVASGEIGIHVRKAGATDWVALNTLLKDYATAFTGASGAVLGSTGRPFKVIVNSNILTNTEVERQFKITMTSGTAYTIYDVTAGNTSVGTGNSGSDTTFSYLGGSITVPTLYGEVANFRPTISGGMNFYFSLKKNWVTSVIVTANSVTNIVRVHGLDRGDWEVKLTCASGTIALDCVIDQN